METKFKEDLSRAYLRAICAKAEAVFNLHERDEDGTDVDINKNVVNDDGICVISNIKVQLKSTSSNKFYKETETEIIYKAKAKCYNDLIRKRATPLYLFLLILPEDEEECVLFSVDQLILKKCMYWVKLEHSSNIATKDFVDISIDKEHYLSPEALNEILQMAGNEI